MTYVNIVSPCCHRGIVQATQMEFPLGGSTYGIAHKVDLCESCGLLVEEPLEVCENCGVPDCLGGCV